MTYYQQFLGDVRKKQKYKNKSKIYNGNKYDSILEANYAEELDWRKKAGDIVDWERQVKIEINVCYEKNGRPYLTMKPGLELKKEGLKFFHITNYFIDFVAYLPDGSEEWIEVKGMELPTWKIKWRYTEAIINYEKPEATLKLVKDKNKFFRKSK